MEGCLLLLGLQPLAVARLSDQSEHVHAVHAVQLDQSPGQLLAHAAFPLGEARLEDVEYRHVLTAQLGLSLQILPGH